MSKKRTFLTSHGHYKNLRVYKVATALYDLTYTFCNRFLSSYGDRTVDQMVQAARSGKQNIAEGNRAAQTSAKMEIKLTGVAKASIEELLTDYEDYLRTRSLMHWDNEHPRYVKLREWVKSELFMEQYAIQAEKMNDEELANLCITLCHQAIYMLKNLLDAQQDRFVTEGGVNERMYAARTGYRQEIDEELKQLREEVKRLKALLDENGIEY